MESIKVNRKKLFVENFLVYGIGGVISKIVPFIMLPIVTRMLPDSYYYGLSDISNIIVSFGSAIAVMGMYDAMFRMFFDNEDEEYKKDICSSAVIFTLCSSIIIFFMMFIFRSPLSNLFFSSYKYVNLFMISSLTILISAINSIVSAPTRMTNKKKIFLVTNTISPIISYTAAVFMLFKKLYIMALPLAALISSVIMLIIFFILNHSWFSVKRIKVKYIKQMLRIALPLAPNFLIYWIFNSCDRFMIGKLIGNEFVGIYGVGAKIGQISQLIYTAFAGGWQYFAFSTMKDKDQVAMTTKILEYLGAISFVASMFIVILCRPAFEILFTGDYVKGFIVVPCLFITPLLLMLYQIACNQFLVIKKTWPNMVILSSGALVNVILNLMLIPYLGIMGAAIATLIGYVFSIIIAITVLNKYKLLNVSHKFLCEFCSVVFYIIIWGFILKDNVLLTSLISGVFIFMFILSYRKELRSVVKRIKKRRIYGFCKR